MSETKDNVTGYIDYHRQMAVKHKDIQHDPDAEDGDGEQEAKRFTRFEADEVIEGLRTSIGLPALLLELYEMTSESEIVYDVCLKPRGSFSVADKPADKLYSSQEACLARCEKIIYQLLQKMWSDHYGPGVNRCTTPFKEINFGKLNIIPFGPAFNGLFGYRCEYEFEFQKTIDIAQAPEEGTFIEE